MAIIFLDGALGSILMEKGGDIVSEQNIINKERVINLHKDYIKSGSNIICSNTFSANHYAKSKHLVSDLIKSGVEIAKYAAEGTATKTAFDIGPLSELLEPYGDLSEEECAEQYSEIIAAGITLKPEYIFFETFMDLDMLEIAIKQTLPYNIPLLCSMSFTEVGKTIMGHSVEQMVERLAEYPLIAIGLNCSMEPKNSLPIAQKFREHTTLPIIFKPNAGKPKFSEGGISYEDAEIFASEFNGIDQLGDVYIGGCCGSTPEHINRLTKKYGVVNETKKRS